MKEFIIMVNRASSPMEGGVGINQKILQKKLRFFTVIITLLFAILVSRLAFIQLLQADQYILQSDQNRIRMLSIPPRRGDIVSRDGQVLSTSYASFSIVTANLGRNMDDVYQHLVNLLADFEIELTVEDINEAVTAQGSRRYEPVFILRDVPFEIVTMIKERQEELPGIDIAVEPRRTYPNGIMAGHLLGYVTQINQEQLNQFRQYDYRIGDPFGQAGLERLFEFVENEDKRIGMRGQKGVRQVEVNVANRPIKELLTIPAVPGNNLVLTIDYNLQQAMEEVLETIIQLRAEEENPKAQAGAAVALDPRTGAILAMASYPTMDPNDWDVIGGLSPERRDYYQQELSPQLNRVLQAEYPPGSTFKMITGMAALENGTLPGETVYCPGGYPGGISCWDVHGSVNYYRAIGVSCNTYFQTVAVRTGADKIARVAQEFGLGQRTGIILGDRAGLAPSPAWKEEYYTARINSRYEVKFKELEQEFDKLLAGANTEQERSQLQREKERRRRVLESQYRIDFNFYTRWQPFDTYNMAIGQGGNSYTMLQLANYTAAIANGGYLYEPYLVSAIVDQNGQEIKKYGPKLIREVGVSKETIEHTRKGMLAVTQPGGTASSRFAHFPKKIQVAGKTGTAQTGRGGDNLKEDYHGLSVGFAPYDNPEIAIAAIVEYGGSGGASAARVAQLVLEEYFGLNGDK